MMYKNPIGDKIKSLIHYTGSKNIHVKLGSHWERFRKILNKELGRVASLGKVLEGICSLYSSLILVRIHAC